MLSPQITTVITDSLAERIRDHLVVEEESLVAVLEAVRGVHRTLRELDGPALQMALQNETEALFEAQQLQSRREQFRDEAAAQLGVAPREFTLGLLARTSSGALQSTIAASRQKLTEMSLEMNRLNRQNAAMIQQSVVIIRGIEERLTGTRASGESYNAGGAREVAHVGSLVQWGG